MKPIRNEGHFSVLRVLRGYKSWTGWDTGSFTLQNKMPIFIPCNFVFHNKTCISTSLGVICVLKKWKHPKPTLVPGDIETHAICQKMRLSKLSSFAIMIYTVNKKLLLLHKKVQMVQSPVRSYTTWVPQFVHFSKDFSVLMLQLETINLFCSWWSGESIYLVCSPVSSHLTEI